MKKELFKIALVVEDIEKSVEYYTKVFDLKVKERLGSPGGDYVFMESDSVFVELMPYANHKDDGLGFHHICFKTDDVAATLKDVADKGATVDVEPFDGGYGITLADVKGPDNVRLRLFNRK